MQPPGTFHAIAGLRTHVVVDGEGPPLLFLAALGGNWFDFDQVTEILRARYTVIRYDRPGYGLSDPLPAGQIPSIAAEVERIDHILDELGITEPVLLAGHSLASLYVEGYARSRPDRVAGVIMLDGSYVMLPLQLVPPGWSNRLAHVAARFIKALRLPRSAGIKGHAIATSPGPPGGFTAAQRYWISEVFNGTRFPRAFLVEQAAFGVLNSQLVALRRTHPLTAPVHVVSALPGRRTPVRLFWNWKQGRYARFLGGSYTPVIPARHFFIVQQPDVAAKLIGDFAAGVTVRG
ncbi:alpha/beta fold hydrolase [Williamsia soli]|uniref:alpha/beta fold hydrolase n=1 Tax=Williamsia soli TaxID=364929 RepID=UPI001A9D4855|nr:alpha/beta hydrolase [Williamsia soli]